MGALGLVELVPLLWLIYVLSAALSAAESLQRPWREAGSRGPSPTTRSPVTAAWLRDFWSYDSRTDEHAVGERLLRSER